MCVAESLKSRERGTILVGVTSSQPGITAASEFLEDRDEGMSVFVETDEIEQAVAALEAATARLYLVTFDGHEYESEDAWLAADEVSGGSFATTNANYIDDVQQRPGGAYLVLDTKGIGTSAMGRTVVGIVTEELQRQGITRANLRPVRRSDWETRERQPSSVSPLVDAGPADAVGPRAWFLVRQLYGPAGRAQFRGIEYRQTDGTWARERTDAVRRDDPELSSADLDWCAELQNQPRPDGATAPRWISMILPESGH